MWLTLQYIKEFSEYSLKLVNTVFGQKSHFNNLMKLYEEVLL